MPTCFSEQLMEQSRSAPDGWGWGAAWETRSIIFILHLLLLLLSLLSYYIIVIVIILRMGSSPGNKKHRLFQSTLILKQLAIQCPSLIESEDPMNSFHWRKKITFFTAFPFYQLQSSKTQQVKKRIGCGSHDVPRPRLRCRWSFPGCRCRTKFSGSTHKTLKHDPVTVVIIVEVALNGQGGKEVRWKRNTCSWFLLWGRKPGPGGSSFWTQQLTPGEKCNSTWNLGFNIIMRDFFWTNLQSLRMQ